MRLIRFALLLTLIAAPAMAQVAQSAKEADAEAEAQERSKRVEQEKEARAKAPPPVIPGAESSGPVAPADRSAAEMSPNDALFDSINRGDASGARDAMNRGAQLDAHNVLGQSPIDAAVEANRNDITFLLLSLRGATASAGPRHAVAVHATRPIPGHGKPARGSRVTQVAAHQAQRPVSNPGVPNPAIGFNGF